MADDRPAARLEYLRGEIRAERISYGEIAELQDLVEHIGSDDVELLQWAGVPEHLDVKRMLFDTHPRVPVSPIMQDPDLVGESAYRAVYDCVEAVAESDIDTDTVIGELDNLIQWATSIRDKIKGVQYP